MRWIRKKILKNFHKHSCYVKRLFRGQISFLPQTQQATAASPEISRNILTFALSMTQDQRRGRGEKVIPFWYLIFVCPLASHFGMIDCVVMSLLCGTLQSMVLRIQNYHNWGICISFDVLSHAKSTSATFDLYLASENGCRLIEWDDHCKERCLKKDQVSIMIWKPVSHFI